MAAGGLLLATLSPFAIAEAQTTWTGSVSNNWNDPGNWSSGLPDISRDVIIHGGMTSFPTIGNDTGEAWTKDIFIGSNSAGGGPGSGQLDITYDPNGSGWAAMLVTEGRAIVGEGTQSRGKIEISGGAYWEVRDSLSLGINGGIGELTLNYNADILHGATVYINGHEGTSVIGDGRGSVGTITINSSWMSLASANTDIPVVIGSNGGTGQLFVNGKVDAHGNLDAVLILSNSAWAKGDGSIARIGIDTGSIQATTLSLGTDGGYAAVDVKSEGTGDRNAQINLQVKGLATVGQRGTAEFRIHDGGIVNFAAETVIGRGIDGRAILNVEDGGTLFVARNFTEAPTTQVGADGARAVIDIAGTGTFGRAATVIFYSGLHLGYGSDGQGTIKIRDGGQLISLVNADSSSGQEAHQIYLGVNGGSGIVSVSGQNAAWYAGNKENDYYDPASGSAEPIPADLHIGYSGTGAVVLANGGTLSVGWTNWTFGCMDGSGACITPDYYVAAYGSNGTVYVADQAGATGALIIGSVPGTHADAPGTLLAANITFGAGQGTLVFNHNGSNYQFAIPLFSSAIGQGTIANWAGTTWLAADNSGFSGLVDLYGGTLGLDNNNSIGTASVAVLADARLAYRNGIEMAAVNTISIAPDATLFIHVDNGSAIQNGAVSNAGNLTKLGAGLLTLTAKNTYTGLTVVSEGVLALSDTGSVSQSRSIQADSVFDITAVSTGSSPIRSLSGSGSVVLGGNDLVLTDADDSFSGMISGNGGLRIIGGAETLSGANNYSGETYISDAILRAGATNTLSPDSPVTVVANGVLDLAGYDQTVLGLANGGTVIIGGRPGTILTVSGNYTGSDGKLYLNTVLGDDNSPTDRLVIGGTASGVTQVFIRNIGGLGAKTTGNGILVIEVNGSEGAAEAGTFTQDRRLVAGAYDYTLHPNGINGDASDGNWYLRSKLRSEVALIASVSPIATEYGYALLGSLHERTGDVRVPQIPAGYEEVSVRGKDGSHQVARVTRASVNALDQNWFSGGWARLIGDRGMRDNSNFEKHGPSYSYDFSGIQAGLNLFGQKNAVSIDMFGFYAAYGQVTAHTKGVDLTRAGSIDMEAYSAGAYWTHKARAGWYSDAVVQGTWYDINARSTHGMQFKPSGFGIIGSLEGGYAFALGGGFIIEPQGQIIYQNMSFDDTADEYGKFSMRGGESLRGRFGVRLINAQNAGAEHSQVPVTMWMRANIWHEFMGNNTAVATGLDGSNPVNTALNLGGTWGEVGAGITGQLSSAVSLFATSAYSRSLDNGDRKAWNGRLGMTIKW